MPYSLIVRHGVTFCMPHLLLPWPCTIELAARPLLILPLRLLSLVKPEGFNSEWIHFVSQIPYDWIFPRIYGVIHHGGSGTTHTALKNGCATMIIPHIIDQFVWDKIIYELGAGPRGIKAGKIATKNLEPKILELINNSGYKEKAEQIASQMEKEDLRGEIYKAIIED